MQKDKQNQIPLKTQKFAVNFYLFLVALYFFLASTYLANTFINLTVEGNIGLYFEFVNASADRSIVYILNFTTMLYVVAKLPQKTAIFSLLFTCVFAGYFLFMQIADALILLVSFVALTWSLTSPEPFSGMSHRKAVSIVVIYLILILIIIQLSSLVCWFVFPFFPRLSQGGICRSLVDLETKMFLLTGCLAPLFAVLFLFSWIAKLFPRCDLLKRFLALFTQSENGSGNHCLKKNLISLLLVCSVVFSFLVTLYPYLPGLNVDTHPIGVDIPLYEDWLVEIGNGDFSSVFTKSFFKHPDRPLSLFAMYLAKYISGLSALTVAQFFPLILGPALVLAVYFFVREATDSIGIPSLAAFLSVSSFHVSVGMYAGFLSNWMALIELYLFMGVFFSSLRKRSYLRFAAALLFSISLLFTHSGAWGMTMGILFVYLLLTGLRRKSESDSLLETRFLLVLVLVNILVGVTRNYALGWSAGNFVTLKVAQDTVSIGASECFWNDLLYTFLHTMYAFFVNPMGLLLAVLGGFIAVSGDKRVNRYLTSWLIGSCVFFVFGSGWGMKSRILFNVPLPVFESLGLAGVCNMGPKFLGPNRTLLIRFLTILFVLLVSLNYAFRCAFTMSQVVYDLFS